MPSRLHRFQQAKDLHFITFSCYRRQPKLGSVAARAMFEHALEQTRRTYHLYVTGYVVVPEHVHLLVTEPGRASLATALQALKQSVSRARLTLVPGEYRIEVSEGSHKTLRTHCKVGPGANLPFTIFLDPEKLPSEELPESLDAHVRPGFTLLHGYVVDSDSGKLITGAKVRVDHANVETRTDSVGHYLLSVPTPVSKYPGAMGTDTLIFEKRGYSTEEFTNFGVGGDEMGGEGNEMAKGSGIHKHDATHKLMKKEPSREGPQKAN